MKTLQKHNNNKKKRTIMQPNNTPCEYGTLMTTSWCFLLSTDILNSIYIYGLSHTGIFFFHFGAKTRFFDDVLFIKRFLLLNSVEFCFFSIKMFRFRLIFTNFMNEFLEIMSRPLSKHFTTRCKQTLLHNYIIGLI